MMYVLSIPYFFTIFFNKILLFRYIVLYSAASALSADNAWNIRKRAVKKNITAFAGRSARVYNFNFCMSSPK